MPVLENRPERSEVRRSNVHVPVDVPRKLRPGVKAHIAGSRSAAGFQQVAWYSLYTVLDALPPEEIRVRRQLQALRQV